jgi:hypothetical protein
LIIPAKKLIFMAMWPLPGHRSCSNGRIFVAGRSTFVAPNRSFTPQNQRFVVQPYSPVEGGGHRISLTDGEVAPIDGDEASAIASTVENKLSEPAAPVGNGNDGRPIMVGPLEASRNRGAVADHALPTRSKMSTRERRFRAD